MLLNGKRAAILTSEMYETLEVWYPYLRLAEEGASISIVGMVESPVEILSRHCYPIMADKSIEEISPDQFDAIIVPGGYAPDMLRRSEAALELIRRFYFRGKIVGALCHGLLVLLSAGLLRGRMASASVILQQKIADEGVDDITWLDRDVVIDGRLITSRTGWALPAFCRDLINILAGVRDYEVESWSLKERKWRSW